MKKFLATGLIVLSLIGTVNTPGFAAENNAASNSGGTSSVTEDYKGKQNLTPEQKAEKEAKRKEWHAKIKNSQKNWSALTDAQKNEIYSLIDKEIDDKILVIDKYAAYGVIDKAAADKMKTRLNEQKTKMRQSGKFPMIGLRK